MAKAYELLLHHFIEQHDGTTREILLDLDGTDVPVHGDQLGKFFTACYYEQYCARGDMKNSCCERMSICNLRLKLIKVRAVIVRNTRRIRVLMSDDYPYKDEISTLVRRLVRTD